MDIITIIGIAIGLSMDAFAVSVTNGFIINKIQFKHAFRIAFSFGLFQAVMPIIGWAAGLTFKVYIESFDHWIAFGLLVIIGIKMIISSKSTKENNEQNCTHFPTLLLLSIATSIDALAVGISFALLKMNLFLTITIIGFITFSISLIGVYIGKKTGHFFEKGIEIFGGIVLILIGIKILIEHIIKGV